MLMMVNAIIVGTGMFRKLRSKQESGDESSIHSTSEKLLSCKELLPKKVFILNGPMIA